MQALLVAAVREATVVDHREQGEEVRDDRVDADHLQVCHAQLPDDCRGPERQEVAGAAGGEGAEGQQVDPWVAQHAGQGAALAVYGGRLVFLYGVADQFLLGRGQPARLARTVGQQEEHQHAKQYGGHAFDEEHPLPAFPAVQAVHVLQDPAGHRAGDEGRRHLGGAEERQHPRAARRRIPEGEIEDDAGEESGFEQAEQETHDVELRRRGDQQGGAGGQAPEDHDAHDGDARADALQQHVARHFEDHVADEEHGGA
ncbi:hypothetical protein D3C80_1184390 [compost metagenome]